MTQEELLALIDRAAAEGWTELDLTGLNLTELPTEIRKLTQLKTLDLSYNHVIEIQKIITNLSILTRLNLTRLNLAYNQICEIPDAITGLSKLNGLNLRNNQIGEIPYSIGNLYDLKSLNLSYNQIKEIPDAIKYLFALTSLNLAANHIKEIPYLIVNLSSNLTKIDLYNNNISEIPDAITKLSSLKVLSLSGNQISEIPDAIANLSNLKVLSLSGNQISEIPDAIANLSNLTELNLSRNQISEIPDAIANLSNLTQLDLGGNQISKIPDAIANLSNLKRLVLEGNPITNVPPEIIQRGWGKKISDDGDPQAIFAYLKTKAQDKRPLNELKVLLVGEADVGKTSLLRRLIHNEFNLHEPKTPGINIEKWHLPERPELRLNLWDFGGQRVMHATHQFFLTKRSLYLLILDNRRSEQQNKVEYWLKLIETFGGNSPVIIIGNCADDEPIPQIKARTLQKKYPQIIKVVPISCKTGQGISDLRQEINRQLDRIPHIRDLLPITWFKIKIQLEKMQATIDFISYENYQDLCQQAEIPNAQDQKVLVQFLHDLGVVLNFQDDPRLNETNVLNPEWVTSGVYDILNNHALLVQDAGILSLNKLNSILSQPHRYPVNKHRFLMGLMEKFELSFPLDGNNPVRYLITDLLPIDERFDTDSYETAPLHFQYHYDILPSSIISRFIVRNHTMIYKTMRWRSGVVLTLDNNKALIRADEEDNLITIKVQGSRASALLAIIRADFTKIHDTVPNLPVKERLVIKELQNEEPTGREVPVDYPYLCELDRQNITESPLPNLEGKYNIRNLLEGVEPRHEREEALPERQNRSRSSRAFRPLKPQKSQTQRWFLPAGMMLLILAGVSAIFFALAHFVPPLQLVITAIAIILVFSFMVIVILRTTGTVSDDTLNQFLANFLKSIPVLKGQDPSKNDEKSPKELPDSDHSEK